MNAVNILNPNNKGNLSPLNLLENLAESQANGCLSVSHNSVNWQLYFHQGLLTYATHSVDPFERLERHLRLLSREIPALTNAVRNEIRLKFEGEPENEEGYPGDYQAIAWLVAENYLNSEAAATLIKRLSQEVFETYLLLTNTQCQFVEHTSRGTYFCHIDTLSFVKEVEKILKAWQALAPVISSPHQRPYFFNQKETAEKISPEQQQRLSKILRGFSFRQMAILVNQDELRVAQYLYPLINQKVAILREPQSPFDLLPKLLDAKVDSEVAADSKLSAANFIGNSDTLSESKPQTQQKIFCVDDSPTILKEIYRFLEGHDLSVHALTDSSKALIEIMRIKPDIILLDVSMPSIDGYKLCRMIRNHSLFKSTPIVMVTGNTSLLDRGKARIAGATDYLTKPFTQSQLVNIVFRYLT